MLNARSKIFCILFGQWLETSKHCQFLKFRFQRIITGTRQESRVQQPLHGEQRGHQGEGQQSCLNGSHCFVHNYFIAQNVDLCYMFMISESVKTTTCIFRNILMCNSHINLLAYSRYSTQKRFQHTDSQYIHMVIWSKMIDKSIEGRIMFN